MSRKANFVLSLAGIAITFALSFASAPAVAYDQGGVIPCSADDYRFVPGRGWVSNCRRGHAHGGGHAHHDGYGGGRQSGYQVHIQQEAYRWRRCTNTSWVIRDGVKIILGVTGC